MKVALVLKLDGCLSIEEIYKMIVRIERNFCKENSYANVDRYRCW